MDLNLKKRDPKHRIKFKDSDYFITQSLFLIELLEKDQNGGYRFQAYIPMRQRLIDDQEEKVPPAQKDEV